MMSALRYINVHLRLKQYVLKVEDSGTNIIYCEKVKIKQLKKQSTTKKEREKTKKAHGCIGNRLT